MATAAHPTGTDRDLSGSAQARLRAALTGSIFAMSVLAYLGNEDTGLVKAVATVVGTGLVIFFGEAYAGLLSASLASARPLPWSEIRHELGVCSMAAAPGVLAGAFLVLADVLGSTTPIAIDVALWLGALTLVALSVLEAHGSHRPPAVRIGSVVASVLIGIAIIVLKALLH